MNKFLPYIIGGGILYYLLKDNEVVKSIFYKPIQGIFGNGDSFFVSYWKNRKDNLPQLIKQKFETIIQAKQNPHRTFYQEKINGELWLWSMNENFEWKKRRIKKGK